MSNVLDTDCVAGMLGISPLHAGRILKGIEGSFVIDGDRRIHADLFAKWRSTSASNGCPSCPSEARPIEEPPIVCGVYLLIHCERVVYVGQSTDVHMRLRNHRREKTFDHALVIEVPDTTRGIFRSLDAAEVALINALAPKLNRNRLLGDPGRRQEWDDWLRISEVRGWIALLEWMRS